MKAVFLDRDGTLIVDAPDQRIDSEDKIKLFPDTVEALSVLAGMDYKVFIVTNQAGIAEGKLTKPAFEKINAKAMELISPSGVVITQIYVCPHQDSDNCICRKPQPTMLRWAAEDFDLDLTQSWMVGDRETDVQAGKAAGTRTILVLSGNTLGESKDADFTAQSLREAIEHIKQAS